jgi:hypothetical protein
MLIPTTNNIGSRLSQVAALHLSSSSHVSSLSQVAAMPARTTPPPSIYHRMRVVEGIDVDVGPLDLEGENLRDVLCVRMMEVVRILCHIKGDMLQALVDEMNQAMTKADTAMVLFARPLGALTKLPIQVFLFF